MPFLRHILLLLLSEPCESVQRLAFTKVVLSTPFPLSLFHQVGRTDVDTEVQRGLFCWVNLMLSEKHREPESDQINRVKSSLCLSLAVSP